MGYFTWTDAGVKNPRLTKSGDYYRADMVGYDRFCKVICPDGSEIIEPSYEGYGIFCGKDIYDLVVDWNKDDLEHLFERKEVLSGTPDYWGCELKDIAIAYQNNDSKLPDIIDSIAKDHPLVRSEWKRMIGITIACEDNIHKELKYPIKITCRHAHKPYNEWNISLSTQ